MTTEDQGKHKDTNIKMWIFIEALAVSQITYFC